MNTPAPAPAAPLVTPLAIAALAVAVIGGIVMASSFPGRLALGVPIALVALSALLLAASIALLVRQRGFAWPTFGRVAGWTLLAYAVSAGMIEFSFVHNRAGGGPLVVVTLLLVVYALTVPLLIGYTVARYHTGPDAAP